jgi:hypothetical protein
MLWFFMVGLYFSCAGPSQTAQKGNTPSRASQYEEDLSVLRQADIQPFEQQMAEQKEAGGENRIENLEIDGDELRTRQAVTSQLNTLLAQSSEVNRTTIKSVPGYTIQVYLGTSRDGANLAQRKVYEMLPEARPEIKFVQPNYKVYVGKFMNRLEAQKTYASLKPDFPNALVIPEKIQINK